MHMTARDINAAVFFMIQLWTTHPAAQKKCECFPRLGEVLSVHTTDYRRFRQRVHFMIKVVHQFTDAFNTPGRLEGVIRKTVKGYISHVYHLPHERNGMLLLQQPGNEYSPVFFQRLVTIAPNAVSCR